MRSLIKAHRRSDSSTSDGPAELGRPISKLQPIKTVPKTVSGKNTPLNSPLLPHSMSLTPPQALTGGTPVSSPKKLLTPIKKMFGHHGKSAMLPGVMASGDSLNAAVMGKFEPPRGRKPRVKLAKSHTSLSELQWTQQDESTLSKSLLTSSLMEILPIPIEPHKLASKHSDMPIEPKSETSHTKDSQASITNTKANSQAKQALLGVLGASTGDDPEPYSESEDDLKDSDASSQFSFIKDRRGGRNTSVKYYKTKVKKPDYMATEMGYDEGMSDYDFENNGMDEDYDEYDDFEATNRYDDFLGSDVEENRDEDSENIRDTSIGRNMIKSEEYENIDFEENEEHYAESIFSEIKDDQHNNGFYCEANLNFYNERSVDNDDGQSSERDMVRTNETHMKQSHYRSKVDHIDANSVEVISTDANAMELRSMKINNSDMSSLSQLSHLSAEPPQLLLSDSGNVTPDVIVYSPSSEGYSHNLLESYFDSATPDANLVPLVDTPPRDTSSPLINGVTFGLEQGFRSQRSRSLRQEEKNKTESPLGLGIVNSETKRQSISNMMDLLERLEKNDDLHQSNTDIHDMKTLFNKELDHQSLKEVKLQRNLVISMMNTLAKLESVISVPSEEAKANARSSIADMMKTLASLEEELQPSVPKKTEKDEDCAGRRQKRYSWMSGSESLKIKQDTSFSSGLDDMAGDQTNQLDEDLLDEINQLPEDFDFEDSYIEVDLMPDFCRSNSYNNKPLKTVVDNSYQKNKIETPQKTVTFYNNGSIGHGDSLNRAGSAKSVNSLSSFPENENETENEEKFKQKAIPYSMHLNARLFENSNESFGHKSFNLEPITEAENNIIE